MLLLLHFNDKNSCLNEHMCDTEYIPVRAIATTSFPSIITGIVYEKTIHD